jgi:hypothetical protein
MRRVAVVTLTIATKMAHPPDSHPHRPGPCDSPIDRPREAVADRQRELVVPYLKTEERKGARERLYE